MKVTARWLVFAALLSAALIFISVQHTSSVAAAPAPQATPLPPEVIRKIEPALLKQISTQKNSLTPFVAYFQAQAQLAPSSPNRVEQRRAVVNALQATAEQAQSGARALLTTRQQQGKASSLRTLWIVNALAASADRDTIIELATRPEVQLVALDHTRKLINDTLVMADEDGRPALDARQIEDANTSTVARALAFGDTLSLGNAPLAASIEWNLSQIRADQVWNGLNIDGSGIVVANLDTGVDWQHPALLSKYRGYRGPGPAIHTGNWYDATGSGYLYPGDGNGHGTHTMGSIVGSTPERVIGVAPGAQWIAVKIFTNAGYATDSWIHTAFQWVVAPEGDPALAPDIISNSWGDDNGLDTAFLLDVRAVRAAGILPVFASGNNGGAGASSVGAPGSYAESFTVGATDINDVVAYFSSRGPSPLTGATKPDISAPGVNVVSSLPGGGYGSKNGTSMATPHIAGVAALLRQAAPTLSITQTTYAITSTAIPLGATRPNNDVGWGRVDAFAAVLQVKSSGQLTGTITTSGAPLAGAQVLATDRISRTVQTTSNASGSYLLPLSEGRYSVSVTAFGYAPSLNNSVWISESVTTVFNTDLSALPTAVVRGHVTELGTGAPLSAKVSALNTPASATTDGIGSYSLTLPVGTYTLRAESWQHRIMTATITLNEGDTLQQNFQLAPAPSILLVDSGAWYNGSQISYYTSALDALGYLYTLHSINSPLTAAPTLTTMLPYSITIWSSPYDSPSYIGAGKTLLKYLDAGGRLFVSGQDVAFWDAGGTLLVLPDYFPQRLYGQFAGDNVPATSALGVNSEPLGGLSYTINLTDSARNQFTLDQVVSINDSVRPLVRYNTGEIGGLAVSTCLPYRAAYLGFGLEGAGPANVRAQTLQNLIEWLVAAPPMRAFALSADTNIAVGLPTQTTTHTLTLRNVGQLADSYAVALSGNAWNSTLWTGDFTQSLSSPINLAPCARQSVGVRTSIPAGVARNISDTVNFNVQSLGDGGLAQTRALVSKTPATVLVVDDDRWYEVEGSYQSALRANNISFDTFDTRYADGPTAAYMGMYPLVTWLSGYDWFDPLSAKDESSLVSYLNAGGHLFYSAQDYLYVRGGASNFARDYLGVLTYTNDVTVTLISGVGGNPISDGLGTYTLTYPYRNFSDYVTPTVGAETTLLGNNVTGSALNMHNLTTNAKTVFFAFPFEALASDAQPTVMRRVVNWLAPLGDSALLGPSVAPPNGLFAYQLQLKSSNVTFASSARITLTLPAEVTVVSLDSPAMSYDAPSRTVYWTGSVPAVTLPQLTVRVNPSVPFNTVFTANAVINDGAGIVITRAAKTKVASAVLYFPFVPR